MYSCAVCHKQYSNEATAAQLGVCECGQALANEQGIGWKHLNPAVKTPPAGPSLVNARESKPSGFLTGEEKAAINAGNPPLTRGTTAAVSTAVPPKATSSTPQTIEQTGKASNPAPTKPTTPIPPPVTKPAITPPAAKTEPKEATLGQQKADEGKETK